MSLNLPIPLKRNLYFSDGVDQESMRKLTESIVEINEDDEHLIKLFAVYNLKYEPEPIKMFIDSYGGEVYSVFGLLAIMESSKVPIHTIATGAAMSCGFLMLISGHKRFAHKYATPLYHQVSSWTLGKLESMKDDLKETKRLQKMIDEIVVRKTKLTKKKLKEINLQRKDWYLSTQESLEWGIIDEII
jgi:ATP-dependent Clp protease protease subunit